MNYNLINTKISVAKELSTEFKKEIKDWKKSYEELRLFILIRLACWKNQLKPVIKEITDESEK